MNSVFQYSLLQYHHSIALGEVMNIGILVFFPNQKQVHFHYPERLVRLRNSYPNFPERVIKSYFRGIDSRIKFINQEPDVFTSYLHKLDSFIDNEILVKDASALQFSEIKTSVLFSEDLNLVSKQIYSLYLSNYDFEENTIKRRDDEYLAKEFKRRVKLRDNKIFEEKVIENYKVNDEYNFPFAWQNGSLNLDDPISFDLQKSDSIRRKADEHFGKFTKLQSFASDNNVKFDLLVARPRESSLKKDYDNAIKTLKLAEHIRIWDEEKIEEYTDKLLAV